MLTIRQASPLLDFPTVMEGAKAFAAHMDRWDILPPNGSKEQTDAAWDMMQMPGFTCLLAEEDGKLQGGIGYIIGPYIHDKTKLHADEFFWWAMPGANPRASMRLINEMFKHWSAAGVKVYTIHRLMNSPEGVDMVYRRKGATPVQVTYAGVL